MVRRHGSPNLLSTVRNGAVGHGNRAKDSQHGEVRRILPLPNFQDTIRCVLKIGKEVDCEIRFGSHCECSRRVSTASLCGAGVTGGGRSGLRCRELVARECGPHGGGVETTLVSYPPPHFLEYKFIVF